MAKTTKTSREQATKAKTRRQRVKEEVDKIIAFHSLGQDALPRQKHEDVYGRGLIEAQAKEAGVNEDTMRKARQFAEEYKEADLEELIAAVRAEQADMDPKRPIFSVSHVARLLGVPSRARRKKLQRRAIAEAWSRAQLVTEIRRAIGRRPRVGRRPYIPRSVKAVYTQIEGLCEHWLRWAQELEREDDDRKHVLLKDLDEPVQELLGRAGKILHKLQTAVAARVKAIQRRAQREQAATRQASARK